MNVKRIISVLILSLMLFSLFSCSAEKDVSKLESVEPILTLRIWNKAEPYAYDLRLGEDTVLYVVEYKLGKDENGYTMNDPQPENATSVKEKQLSGKEIELIGGYLKSLDALCREKGGNFDGPKIHLNYNGEDYYYTYGQCFDKDYDDLVTALIELSPIEITDSNGAVLEPTPTAE